jgi:hypothetical protein
MALGTRKQRERQESLWVAKQELPVPAAHPFCDRRHGLLESEKLEIPRVIARLTAGRRLSSPGGDQAEGGTWMLLPCGLFC